MSHSITTTEADQALKAAHRAMWALGDYHAVATEIIAPLGPTLVAAAGIGPGSRVVDVAAGAGNVAIPAALAGATVVATDLTPQLLEAGARDAAAHGAAVTWREADAEAMPCDDGEHDVALSCVGVMFAPHHQVAADELIRIVRPGGTIGLISWTPEGFIGQKFAVMKRYAAAPPAGVQPPPLWGSEEHVRGLLGDRVTDVVAARRMLRVDHFETPEALREYFKANYGPTIAVYRRIADDPALVATLDDELAELARRFDIGVGTGPSVLGWEYLLLTARVAAPAAA